MNAVTKEAGQMKAGKKEIESDVIFKKRLVLPQRRRISLPRPFEEGDVIDIEVKRLIPADTQTRQYPPGSRLKLICKRCGDVEEILVGEKGAYNVPELCQIASCAQKDAYVIVRTRKTSNE